MAAVVPVSSRFRTVSWRRFRLSSQKSRPKPVLGHFLSRNVHTLPKVRSRGHVYPLSYLSYFEISKRPASPRPGPNGEELHGDGLPWISIRTAARTQGQ